MDGDRGRGAVRGVRGSPRARDPPRREDADWERHRSRSPLRVAGQERCNGNDGETEAAPVIDDLGSALLSGALHVVPGAPSPPVLHPDPVMEFYKGLCSDDIGEVVADNHGLGSHAR